MILSTLDDARRYDAMHLRFPQAFDFLTSTSLENLDEGRHAIDGDDVFAIAWKGLGMGQSATVLECHRKYIDIQFVVSGWDLIGWRPLHHCQRVKQSYDEATDLAFYFDQPESWCRVPARSFAIFYPEDVHAPLGTNGALKKIVVKVKLD